MAHPVYLFANPLSGARVDREAGVIRGVAVITEGPALGHGMTVDGTTLSQVKTSAESYKNGLKVKMTHEGDAGDIVGYLTGFRLDGTTLRADFHLLKSSPHREYIFEIAETIPDTFGMSISFSGPDEEKEGKRLARCVEIYSCDLVAEPAANPSGLFSEGTKPNTPPTTSPAMTPEEINKAITDGLSANLAPVLDRLSKLEGLFPKEGEEPELSAKTKSAVALASRESALAVIKEFNLSAPPPAKPSAPVVPPETSKKFEEIVRELKAGGKKHNDALSEAMSSHPEAHKDYLSRTQRGEVIMF